jgi:hypothetical protein
LTVRGEYSLADATYDDLLGKLAARDFAGVPAALRANLIAYYGAANPLPGNVADEQKRSARIRLQLASLTATQTSAIGR